MSVKRKRSALPSPRSDDPPEITDRWLAEAEARRGAELVKRGRPRLQHPRRLLSIRLPPSVIDAWKASGAGWQSRMAELLERSAPKGAHAPKSPRATIRP
jgi:uncharacterized protein (DUF4415 family)